MVHGPASLLKSLMEKIDKLTALVRSQPRKEDLLDVESRLKKEFKLRENRLIGEIGNLSSTESPSAQNSSEPGENKANSKKTRRPLSSRAPRDTTQIRQLKPSTASILKPAIENSIQTKSQVERKPSGSDTSDANSIDAVEPADTHSCTPEITVAANISVPPIQTEATVCGHEEILTTEVNSWKMVSKKQRPSITPKPAPGLGKLLGAKRVKKQVFYLGGVSLECSAEDITSFCSSHCTLLDCRMMPSRRTGTLSARLIVSSDDSDVMQSIDWPEHVYLRKWKFDTSPNFGKGGISDHEMGNNDNGEQ